MIKFLLFITIVCSSLYADFQVYYLKNSSYSDTIHDIKEKKFIPSTSKKSLGMRTNAWLKVEIKNEMDTLQDNYLQLRSIHLMEEVVFFTVINGEVIKKSEAFNRYTDTSKSIRNTLIYRNFIDKNSAIDVYIKIKAKSHIVFELESSSLEELISQQQIDGYLLLFLIAALFTLSIYYTFIYIFTPNKSYLYYVLFILSLCIFSFHLYGGYAKYFDVFNSAFIANAFIPLSPIFTIFFFKSLFEDALANYIKVKIFLNTILGILMIYFLMYVLSRIDLLPYFSLGIYGTVVYALQLFGIMGIALFLYFKKVPYMGLFLLGYTINFVGALISIGFFAGEVPYTLLTFHANILGGVGEAILFSILLTFKIRSIYEENQKALVIFKKQNERIEVMNETLSFVAHQWRQPLSQINASVMRIDDTLDEKGMQVKEIENELAFIEKSTQYMSQSIDDFKNLFIDTKTTELFDINDAIKNSIAILNKSFTDNKIKIKLDLGKNLIFKGNINELSQVLVIILNNAQDVITEKNIIPGLVTIKTYVNQGKIYLEILDNGGGIPLDTTEKIFGIRFSSKHSSRGSGLGLHIAKTIIEGRMKGDIRVKNKNHGACFTIELPGETNER